MKKICTKCKKEKDISEFSLLRNNVYRSRCNYCKNEDNRIYRLNNKEKVKKSKERWSTKNSEYWKNYYDTNKEELKEYYSDYYAYNRDDMIEKSKDYYKENKEKILIRNKEFIQNNKDLFRKRWLSNYYKQRKKNPHIFAWRILLKNALKRMNTEKNDLTINLLGYSANDLKNHLEELFQEGMNWNNWGMWHIHHIKPVAKFDKDTHPSVVNNLDNLIPLWKEDHKKIHKENV